jgi:hypothetical protein
MRKRNGHMRRRDFIALSVLCARQGRFAKAAAQRRWRNKDSLSAYGRSISGSQARPDTATRGLGGTGLACARHLVGHRTATRPFNCTKELALDFGISLLCNREAPSTGCTPSCVRRKRWPRPIP